jgi:hypothetical protein
MKSLIIFILFIIYFDKLILCSKVRNHSSTKTDKSLASTSTEKATTTTKCTQMCLECSMNDLNFCTQCHIGTYKYEFNCFAKCPDGTYLDSGMRTCIKCNESCPICWGGAANMCGETHGVYTSVFSLRNEIKTFLTSYTFTKSEIDKWISQLKIILTDFGEQITTNNRDNEIVNFTPSEVYSISFQQDQTDLPIGSFSDFGGVFIPIPSYLNMKREVINSHWVFKKGMWDGKQWISNSFPRLPQFIKIFGEKNKIYYENLGFWIYDQMRDWYWMKNEINSITMRQPLSNVSDSLVELNTIKIDVL